MSITVPNANPMQFAGSPAKAPPAPTAASLPVATPDKITFSGGAGGAFDGEHSKMSLWQRIKAGFSNAFSKKLTPEQQIRQTIDEVAQQRAHLKLKVNEARVGFEQMKGEESKATRLYEKEQAKLDKMHEQIENRKQVIKEEKDKAKKQEWYEAVSAQYQDYEVQKDIVNTLKEDKKLAENMTEDTQKTIQFFQKKEREAESLYARLERRLTQAQLRNNYADMLNEMNALLGENTGMSDAVETIEKAEAQIAEVDTKLDVAQNGISMDSEHRDALEELDSMTEVKRVADGLEKDFGMSLEELGLAEGEEKQEQARTRSANGGDSGEPDGDNDPAGDDAASDNPFE